MNMEDFIRDGVTHLHVIAYIIKKEAKCVRDFLEILICTLAVFGGYTILDMVKTRILYPRCVRSRLRGAIVVDSDEEFCAIFRYARYLQREQKISSEQLIILLKDDIIKDETRLSKLGDVFCLGKTNIEDFKGQHDDT